MEENGDAYGVYPSKSFGDLIKVGKWHQPLGFDAEDKGRKMAVLT